MRVLEPLRQVLEHSSSRRDDRPFHRQNGPLADQDDGPYEISSFDQEDIPPGHARAPAQARTQVLIGLRLRHGVACQRLNTMPRSLKTLPDGKRRGGEWTAS